MRLRANVQRGAIAKRNPDRFTAQDLVVEGLRGLSAKPARLVMTTLGVMIGIATLVVTIGFAETAARRISQQFDAVAATHAVVRPTGTTGPGEVEGSGAPLPWSSVERVRNLAGVQAAALLADLDLPPNSITSIPVHDPSAPPSYSPPLAGASPEWLDALGGYIVSGRNFDAGHDERADRVVVLGAEAAERLGVQRLDRQPSIFIEGRAFTVIGITDGLDIRTDLVRAAIIPLTTAQSLFELRAPEELHLEIAIGAGELASRQVPIALEPGNPGLYSVAAPPPPSELRRSVTADVNLVFLALGLVALLGGGIGIANVTLMSVSERAGEIGLRRALGADDRDIRRQFMFESSVTGLLGGLIGAALGSLAILTVCVAQSWTPALHPLATAASAVVGALVGIAAGIYPASRAIRIEPAVALRGGT